MISRFEKDLQEMLEPYSGRIRESITNLMAEARDSWATVSEARISEVKTFITGAGYILCEDQALENDSHADGMTRLLFRKHADNGDDPTVCVWVDPVSGRLRVNHTIVRDGEHLTLLTFPVFYAVRRLMRDAMAEDQALRQLPQRFANERNAPFRVFEMRTSPLNDITTLVDLDEVPTLMGQYVQAVTKAVYWACSAPGGVMGLLASMPTPSTTVVEVDSDSIPGH